MPVAETLGVVGSIIAIVQISKTIISACHFYIDAIDGVPSDLRVILIEVSALKGIAKSLEHLTQPNVANSTLLDQLAGVTGSIEGCKKALQELDALFPPPPTILAHGQSSMRRKLNAAAATLAWPLKKGQAKMLLQEIMQHKTTISLALTAEFVRDVKDIKQKAERILHSLSESERIDICRYIETTNTSDIHDRSQRLYEPGTASWMLRTPEWALWMEGKHRCLWINGIPGAGKSILASHLAEEIEKHCTYSSSQDLKLGYAYYYCYFGHKQDEASHFLGWIIGQLCRQSQKVPGELQRTYKSGKSPSLPNILSILHSMMEFFDRVYVVLDAVDESMPRADLLRVIRDLSTDARFFSLSLIVTSRQYIDIEQVMESCSVPISMSNPFVEEDIGTLVQSTVRSDVKYQRWSEELKRELQDTIPKKAKGMFRWAVCQLDTLKRLRPDASIIRAALSNLPKTLDETYERIFLAIPEDDWLSVQHAFHWMVYHNDLFTSNIPLNTLLQALQQSTAGLISSEAEMLHDFESLRELCGCLIMIESERHGDFQHNTVSFAHYTVTEYLLSSRISQKRVGFFSLEQERIQKQFPGIALHQALALQRDSVNGYKDSQMTARLFKLLDADFRPYCCISSVLHIIICPESVSSDSSLMELIEALIDPGNPSYKDMTILLDTAFQHGRFPVIDYNRMFWKIKWDLTSDSSRKIMVFLTFLVLGEASFHLARTFARKHAMVPILTRQLRFERLTRDIHLDGHVIYQFEGSVPELVALGFSDEEKSFKYILDLISDHGTSHFDMSTLLLLYIHRHIEAACYHNLQKGAAPCMFERLLSLGANTNGPEGAFVTPLQVAVFCLDVSGVEILLHAGAKVNALGIPGCGWPTGSLMEPFNDLHGLSPLHIIKNCLCISESMPRFRGNARKRIEMKLLEFGAEDIGPEIFQSEQDAEFDKEDDCKDELEGDGTPEADGIIE